ncbi:MAG: hypothetical protein OEZ34_08240 [Spirochaetia bacterium]|nr:hypothetical protein [Spirochaetia bacterium]
MNYRKVFLVIFLLGVLGSLNAQPLPFNREQEQKDFPEIYKSERIQDANIFNAYKSLSSYGHLVQMAQEDRMMNFERIKDPYNPNALKRNITYTPRNTYVRYVKESAELLLIGFGPLDKVQATISEKVKVANANNIPAKEIQFGNRGGIELTQFTFIYDPKDPKREAIGSRRKTVTLFFDQTNQAADAQQNLALSAVVARVVNDNFIEGSRNIELIIDPSPGDEQLEDVMIIHRENNKDAQAISAGMMRNNGAYPHRLRFKQRFYSTFLSDFDRLYTLVDSYSQRDGEAYNESVILELENQMDY